jgi:hypothetical protein
MRRFKTQLAYGLALAGGAALWLVTMLISGRGSKTSVRIEVPFTATHTGHFFAGEIL